jgi:3-hydroxyphenylacetate 6-hydroxylase
VSFSFYLYIYVSSPVINSVVDTDVFADAWEFNPDRWLAGTESQSAFAHQFAFGIGGRSCVASHLAHNSLYTVFLHLIAHFKIEPVDGEGAEAINPLNGLKRKEGMIGTPTGFKAKFTPRDEKHLVAWLDQN